MSKYLKGKRVLVTGGTGLIGIPLVRKLDKIGADVRIVSLDDESPFEVIEFVKGDICNKDICEKVLQDIQVVFHLAGIKGSIGVAQKKASTFLVKNIMMNMHIMEAARKSQIERFLYASSICVYPPAQVFEEKNAFSGLPHPSDKFGGMAKLIGEMQIEAYKLQYNLENFMTVRPANTYGPHDNFNPVSALIIPALIYRLFEGENPLTVWGDGSAVRDFVYADDVADFMIQMVEQNETIPLNVGSGEPTAIKFVAETVVKHAEKVLGNKIDIKWDTTKPTGEKYRVTSIEKAKSILGWTPEISLDAGIERTVRWYGENRSKLIKRYDIMTEDEI
ncbi:MAG: NAD-dependent epimerase/dehydratase family protein [Deltaproteobacteria bacterium]|nr:NAD-dependent epimerase/dehydratase family protein [Deltaproteobacteria bacterium]